MLLIGGGLSAFAQDAVTEKFNCIADTWVRESNNSGNYGGATVELNTGFAALFGFNYNLPTGMKVEKATLHLVSERQKGSTVDLFGYVEFNETTKWNDEVENMNAAENNKILNFTSAGEYNKTISEATKDEYKTLDAWTNNLDVTSWVKNLPYSAKGAYFMLKSSANNRFYTKENNGVSGLWGADVSFTAEELMPYLEVTFVEDTDITSQVILPAADTFVRSSAGGNSYGGQGDMEIYWIDNSAKKEANVYFAGMMRFDLPADLMTGNYEVTDASLRLVSVQNKSSRVLKLYPFVSFDENCTWNSIGAQVEKALDTTPFATFEVKGQGNKNLGADTDITDENADVAQWTNIIDVTDYINSLLKDDATEFSFLMEKEAQSNNAIRISTKETQEIKVYGEEILDIEDYEGEYLTKVVNNVTKYYQIKNVIPASDLVPQLTITYVKKPFVPDLTNGDDNTTLPSVDEDGTLQITTSDVNGNAVINVSAPEGTTHVYYKVGDKKQVKAYANEDDPYADFDPADDKGGGTYAITLNEGETGGNNTLDIRFVQQAEGAVAKELAAHTINYNITVNATPDAVETIEAAASEAVYFNLQGVKVANPERGIYIKVQNGKAIKVIK